MVGAICVNGAGFGSRGGGGWVAYLFGMHGNEISLSLVLVVHTAKEVSLS